MIFCLTKKISRVLPCDIFHKRQQEFKRETLYMIFKSPKNHKQTPFIIFLLMQKSHKVVTLVGIWL